VLFIMMMAAQTTLGVILSQCTFIILHMSTRAPSEPQLSSDRMAGTLDTFWVKHRVDGLYNYTWRTFMHPWSSPGP
jgi:hypothetical protein